MTQKTRTFFAFRNEKTGDLVRLAQYEDRGPRYTTACHYSLTSDTEFPVFEANSLEALALVLFDDTPCYNTNETLPGWGAVRPDELIPVKVTQTEDSERVSLPQLLKLKTVSVRTIPEILARKYVGEKLTLMPQKDGLVFWLVQRPEGETLESLQFHSVGTVVYAGDRYTRRHVYACLPVPEEFVNLFQGKEGALLIASESL